MSIRQIRAVPTAKRGPSIQISLTGSGVVKGWG